MSVGGERKRGFQLAARFRQEMFSGKLFKKEHPLVALVTGSPFRNVSFEKSKKTLFFRLLGAYLENSFTEKSVFLAFSERENTFRIRRKKALGAGSSGVENAEKDTEKSVFSDFSTFLLSKRPSEQALAVRGREKQKSREK